MPTSNQTTINSEDEDFEKIVTFKGGAIAIVDAAVMKALKNTPFAKGAVLIPLKSSLDNPSFKIIARYDDATLRKLIMIPADADEAAPDITTPEDRQDDLSENSVNQLRGHGGDAPARKIAQLTNPKAKRQNRNRLASTTNRPPVDPTKKMEGVRGQVGAATGNPDPGIGSNSGKRKVKQAESRRRNPFMNSVCRFLNTIKEGTVSDNDIRELPNKSCVLEALYRMKARCFGGWKLEEDHYINDVGYTADPGAWDLRHGVLVHKGGKKYDFDLIYEAINYLKTVTDECVNTVIVDSEEIKLFEELILRRLDIE